MVTPLLASWLSDAFSALIQLALVGGLLLWAAGYFLARAAARNPGPANPDALTALLKRLFGR